jgi:hypothetical protein
VNNGRDYDRPAFSHYPSLREYPGNSTHEPLLKFMPLKEMSKSADAPLVWNFINSSIYLNGANAPFLTKHRVSEVLPLLLK